MVTLLREEMPWIIGIHRLDHRLELAANDCFKKTFMEEVTEVLMNLYYVYHKLPKRLR